jgi:hypothetical protein
MAVSSRRTILRGRANKGSRRNVPKRSLSSQSHLKKSRKPARVKYRGARISRARLHALRDNLDGTRAILGDLHENFWVTSEHEIRERLAKTQEKIGRLLGRFDGAA